MSEPSYIDLFCGSGGLSLGFKEAGFHCPLAIDSDPDAAATYRRNLGDQVRLEPINEGTILDQTSLIVGGPPCQGFSSAGARRSNDKRNTLVRVFSALVAQHRPLAFVFENVEGFLTADGGNRVFDLLVPLVDAGYRIHLRKLNTANYGVPQLRKRVIAIGGLGWDPEFPEATHMAFGAPGASNSHRHLPRCPTVGDALSGLPQPQSDPPGIPQGHYSRSTSEAYSERIHLLKQGQTMKDLPTMHWHASYSRRAHRRVMDGTPTERRGGPPAGIRRLREDQPAKAITGGAISEFVHPREDRFLTMRECARIQTFPDDFEFEGSPTSSILQIGNAVPPELAKTLALHLRARLQDLSEYRPVLEGALLSFHVTSASSTSPALKRVLDRVLTNFSNRARVVADQGQLWH